MVKHGYNENWHERDKVYEEMPDGDKRLLSGLVLHNLHAFLYQILKWEPIIFFLHALKKPNHP